MNNKIKTKQNTMKKLEQLWDYISVLLCGNNRPCNDER